MREESTTKGFAMLSLAGIFAKILSVLYIPILLIIIGRGGLGIYSKTYEVFTFIYALTNIGMQTAIAKYVSELTALGNHRDALRVFKISRTILLIIGTVFTITLMLSANSIAEMTSNPDIIIGLIMLAPTIALTSVLVCYRAYFQGKNNMKPVAISTVVEQFANVSISLFGAYILLNRTHSISLGSAGATIGTSLGALIGIIYLAYIYKSYRVEKEVREKQKEGIRPIHQKRIIRTLIKYGVPITLSAALQNFGALVDMANVTKRLIYAGCTQVQSNELYGILTEYKTLLYVPMVIIAALGTVVLPAISKALVLKDKKDIKAKINFALRMTYSIAIPSAIGLMVLSKELYRLFYRAEDGHELMLYGAVVLVFMAVVQIQNVILQGISKFYYVVFSMVVGIILKISANYYFIGQSGIKIRGAVIGGFLCFFVPMVMNNIKINKTLKIKLSLFKMTTKPLLSSLYMALAIFIARFIFSFITSIIGVNKIVDLIMTILLILIGSFFYLQALIYLGGVRKKEIEAMTPKAIRIMPSILKKHLR
ncbi:stage V sporulation protein B [Clostridium cavendishii DSM 21758]|uniref:Stage V sporulation protein B n=1 Tax=Clostridium cavendishii DSM 21758 TaxID=1121302 RepID=A0A1M6EMB2_9CLOT|nr:polysaccharide biosynthesis protein [Clostridium cavendishii]SHI86631.1 stage V sporulation protein B [Clostridium cavendishii DSM 21758]